MAIKSQLPRPTFDTKIVTPMFRLSYPSVFETSYNELAKRDEYKIVMLFDKKTQAELKGMYELMAKVANVAFGPGAKGLKSPFKDGDTARNQAGELIKDKNPSNEGMLVLSSWSKNRPGVVNAKNQIILDHDEIYGGCFCKAQLQCYAYSTGGNKGVTFGFLHLQKVKDGDPFGNRTKPEDAFSPLEQEETLAEEAAPEAMFGN